MTAKDHLAYRPDIDGLRALAVLAVIGFHAFPELVPGGFIGVDIFFVISGYLISGIIGKGLANGTFSFADFYVRRIRRIFPALTLVVACCLLAGYFLLLADEYKQVAKQAISGLFFVANFALWTEAGYFDTAAELKPFLHLWSLGIEEQFYLLWPVLMWLLWRSGKPLALAIGGLAGLSFLANVIGVEDAQVTTFYWPHTRVWELLAGAWLAARQSGVGGVPRNARLADLTGILGLLLLLASCFALDRTLLFPGYWAALPVLGAVLVIRAGPHAWSNRLLLSQRAMVFIGLISYPLYLWHWPLLTFPRIINGGETVSLVRLSAVALAMLLAWLTYALLERKVRFRPSWHVPASLVAVALGLAAGAHVVRSQEGMADRLPFVRQAESAFRQAPAEAHRCRQQLGLKEGHCVASSASLEASRNIILFIGDSHARAIAQGFAAFPGGGVAEHAMVSVGERGCLGFAGIERIDRGRDKLCRETIGAGFDYALRNPQVDTVVLVGRYTLYHNAFGYRDKRSTPVRLTHDAVATTDAENPNPAVFAAGLRGSLEALRRAGKRVIFLHMAPELGFSPRRCVERPFANREDGRCATARPEVDAWQRGYRASVAAVLKDFPEVRSFDPNSLLCDDSLCRALREGQLLYRDDDHLNAFGASLVLQAMVERLIVEK